MAHLGYLQIDTIYVIERSHHHILYTRIPTYRREHLHQAQSIDKTVFEYWTHALSYVPTESLRFYVRQMRQAHQDWQRRIVWFGKVSNGDLRRVLSRIRRHGALTIRDIEDEPVEKDYAWASRKPSKRVLEVAFYKGLVTISQRVGMLKTYELMTRHFGWDRLPRAATERETLNYLLDRALQSQGIVSVESICHLDAPRKPAMRRLLESRVRRKELVPVQLEGAGAIAALGPSGYPRCHSRSAAGTDSYPVAVRPADHPAQATPALLRLRVSLRSLRSQAQAGIWLFRLPSSDRGSDRCRPRPQNRPVAEKTSGAALALDRPGRSRAHQQQVEAALHKFEQFQLCRS